MKVNITNHNKDARAALCPSGCGVIVRWSKDLSSGKYYYTDIGTREKHCCGNKSLDLAAEELSKPQFLEPPNFKTPKKISEENTEKANQAISRMKVIEGLQTILHILNKYVLYVEGQYRLIRA